MHIVSFQDFACPAALLVHQAVTQRGGDPKKAVVMFEDNRRPAVTFTAPVAFNMIRIGSQLIRLPWTIRVPWLHMAHHVAVELKILDSWSQPGRLIYSGICDGHDISVTLPRETTL